VDVAQRAHLGDGRRAGGQRAGTVKRDGIEAKGGQWSADEEEAFKARSASSTRTRATPTTRRPGWDDGVIDPADTRRVLALGLAR
jgi:3-methylcrotonyl-CoA carboxylase beta subunit